MVSANQTQMQLNNLVGRHLSFCVRSTLQLLLQWISNILNSSLSIIVIIMKNYEHHRFHRNLHRFIQDFLQMKKIIADRICER